MIAIMEAGAVPWLLVSWISAELLRELGGAARRGGNGGRKDSTDVVRLEMTERGVGRTTLRRDLFAQPCRWLRAIVCHAPRAPGGLDRELATYFDCEAECDARLLEHLDQQKEVRGSAARDGGDRVEIRFALQPDC